MRNVIAKCSVDATRVNTDIVRAKITRDIFGSDDIGSSVDAAYVL